MDLPPALLPVAKRRVAGNTALKPTMVGPKMVKKEKPPTQPLQAAPVKPRPKRAFGVTRNTNIPLEKPQLKQQKPAGAISNLAKRNGTTKENTKLNPTGRKKKQLQPLNLKEDKERKLEEAMRTPLPVVKKVVEDGTPYLSALNCSKCRLDRLETSSYWLNQIRLSEAVGKHFVSAAFFRLALECHAQPFEKIRSELKNYTKRHQTISAMSLFDDLLQSYGLNSEKPKSEYNETLIPESKKETLFSGTFKDVHEEKTDGFVCKTKKCTLKEEHDDCNSNQASCSDVSREQPKSEQRQDKIVKTENSEVVFSELIEEANEKPKQHVLKDCSHSASDERAVRILDKNSTPTKGSLLNMISTACLEKKSSANNSGNSANERSKSAGKQAAKNEKIKCISISQAEGPAKDEVAILTDSVVT